MKQISIKEPTLQFLRDLAGNNNREWFNDHKSSYTHSQQNMIDFVDGLIGQMNQHDQLENDSGKKSLFRIYNDVRFSKDKAPYKVRFAFSLQRATKARRGGYYVNITPGGSFLACGFFGPNPEDLKRIRQDIDVNYEDWNALLDSEGIRTSFGELRGEKVATSPKGYSKDHPAIGLLRHKQFIFRRAFTDQEVLADDFLEQVDATFGSARPWLDYMSMVLTTDLNGELMV
jgi:uncharacterized protein (TIGR02453 family)